MAEDVEYPNLLTLTAEIVAAHVSHNSVHASDLPRLIANIHGALAGLDAPVEAVADEPEHKPAVSVRKSLSSDEHIISMIDGKPYRALRRHLRTHGLTDKEYRARYNLPVDYPMVSKGYSIARAAMAQAIGLGRKAGGKVSDAATAARETVEETVAPVVEKAKRVTKKATAATATDDGAKPAVRRGRKAAAQEQGGS